MTTRRNAFAVPAESRVLLEKTPPVAAARPKPEVSREYAELADFMLDNPVFTGILNQLQREAVERFSASALGPEGVPERETARHELEALSRIKVRLGAIAADLSLFPADDAAPTD